MTSYIEHKASDPNAGDKEWDRVKERDLEDWYAEKMREENAKAEMEVRNTLMLMRLFGGWPT